MTDEDQILQSEKKLREVLEDRIRTLEHRIDKLENLLVMSGLLEGWDVKYKKENKEVKKCQK